MGEGNFGGDGSVAWEVKAGHLRQHNDDPDPDDPTNPKKRKQTGIDDTPDKVGWFDIEIQLPANPDALKDFLEYFTDKAKPGGKIKFKLPIEADQHKQVSISWKSGPPPLNLT
jgi:hypothetical protein